MESKTSNLVITMHNVLYKISKSISYLGMTCTILMMLMIVLDVIMRFLFNKPILGTVELASYMLSIIVFTTIPMVESEEGHISISILFDRLPRKIGTFIYAFVYIIGIGILVLISWSSFLLAADYMQRNRLTSILYIPVYPFVYLAAVCIALYALIMLINLLKRIFIRKSRPAYD